MSVTRSWLPLLLAGALLFDPGGVSAEPVREAAVSTDLEGAIEMARRALQIGRADVSVSISRQILQAVPTSVSAHLLLAAGLTRTGAADEAVPAARAGFRLASTREERFEAAYLTAEALAASGRIWASKVWLRRADLYAPSAAHEAVLGQAYRTVSAQSRIGFALSLFGGPSDNVNGGSLHDTFWLWGVIAIPIAEALPGHVAGVSAQLSYRLSERMQARVNWSHAEVFLSDRARAIDPTARAADFRKDELSLGLDHVWQDAEGRLALLSSASIARRWTGGDVDADAVGVSVEVRRAMSTDWTLSAEVSLEAVDIPGATDIDSLTGQLTLSTSYRSDTLGATTFSLGLTDVASDAAGVAWRGPSMAVTWRPPIRSEHFGLILDLRAEEREYWRTPAVSPDLKLGVSLTADLPSLEVMGFNPTVTLSGTRTRSDVVVRDTQELGVSFGIASTF